MSEEPPKRNGIWALGSQIVTALPTPFLALALLNVAFLAVVLHFLDDQMAQRTAMATKILDACVAELHR